MAASAPFIATQQMLQSAVAAQGALDRSMVIATPLRWLYQAPLYRLPTAAPTMSPMTSDNMSPGEEYYRLQVACGADAGPMIQEPY